MELIKRWDILSQKAFFFVNKDKRFKTLLGGCLSITAYLFILFFTFLFLNDLFQKTQIKLIYNEQELAKPIYNMTRYPFLFQLKDEDGKNFDDAHKIFEIEINKISIQKTTNKGVLKFISKSSIIEWKKCNLIPYYYYSSSSKGLEYSNLLNNSDLIESYCLDLSSEMALEQKSKQIMDEVYFTITVSKCDNDSSNRDISININNSFANNISNNNNYNISNSTCYSKDLINNYIINGNMLLKFIDFKIDNNNYNSPAQGYLREEKFALTGNTMKRAEYIFRDMEYTTDYGLLFSYKETVSFTKQSGFHSENVSIQPKNQKLLFLTFSLEKIKATYSRNYEKLQTCLASIYAMTRLIIFLFNFSNNLLNELNYFNFICNYINIFEKLDSKDLSLTTPVQQKGSLVPHGKNSGLFSNKFSSPNNINYSNCQPPSHRRNFINRNFSKNLSMEAKLTKNKEKAQGFNVNFYSDLNTSQKPFNTPTKASNNAIKCNFLNAYDSYVHENIRKHRDRISDANLINANKFKISAREKINIRTKHNYELNRADISSNRLNRENDTNKIKDNNPDFQKLIGNIDINLSELKIINNSNYLTSEKNKYLNLNINDIPNANYFQNNDIMNSFENTNQIKLREQNFNNINNTYNKSSKMRTNNINISKLQQNQSSNCNFNNIIKANNNIDNNFAFFANKRSNQRYFKKPIINKLHLSCLDIVKKNLLFTKTRKIKALELAINYVKKKLSVEEILRKMLEIDKLKFLTLDIEMLDEFYKISGPNIFSENNLKITNVNDCNFDRNLFFESKYLDNLWSLYEFKDLYYENNHFFFNNDNVKNKQLLSKISKIKK